MNEWERQQNIHSRIIYQKGLSENHLKLRELPVYN